MVRGRRGVRAIGGEAVRINITERVNPSGGTQEVVLFASPVGSSRGRWMGPEPARPGVYDVELDFPDEVGAFEVLAPGRRAAIDWSEASGAVLVIGTVVSVGDAEDPVVGISLGWDGGDVVLLEVPSARAAIAVGNSVGFSAVRLDIYPCEL